MGSVEIEQRDDGCLTLTFNNPRVRNALSLAMLVEIQRTLAAAAQDPKCRLVVFRGFGADFCAGRDISDVGDIEALSDDDLRRDLQPVKQTVLAIHDFPKPVMSAVTGYALGLGASIVALSDIAIADAGARFGYPEVKIGIPPSLTTISLLATVPPKAALPLLFGAAMINAREAQSIHLITKACDPDTVAATTEDWIDRLSKASPSAVAMCKRLVRTSAGLDFASKLDLAVETAVAGFRTEDATAGRRAFLKKERRS
ncbi:MAG: hypothetical protein GEU91_01605 [Rhizobiales bacterium]|nr:hypothetical protein [Hyphomicrobiales bacterium]